MLANPNPANNPLQPFLYPSPFSLTHPRQKTSSNQKASCSSHSPLTPSLAKIMLVSTPVKGPLSHITLYLSKPHTSNCLLPFAPYLLLGANQLSLLDASAQPSHIPINSASPVCSEGGCSSIRKWSQHSQAAHARSSSSHTHTLLTLLDRLGVG